MTPEQWEQVGQLYQAALELKPAERTAFLNQACGENQSLRLEVESLLTVDGQAEDFLGAGALEDAAKVLAEGQSMAVTRSLAGQQLGHYQVLDLIGAGGMGEVYLAEDARLRRKVALKLLPAAFTQDVDRVRRFEQEARAASALNHPNIITIHDLGESEWGCFIVMEHVAGCTLRTLAVENVALGSLLDWGNQVAKALSAAHAANILHRDIKPDNIMVRDDGYVKVLDFGLARLNTAHDELSGAMTMPGTVMGTVKYMSPEQTRGEVVTTASDIFAFGIVLYELATGQHPFIGATLFAVMQAITTQTPFAPSHLKPELPAELNTLLLRMLAKDAAARPSAIAVAAMLEAIARGSHSISNTPHSALRTLHSPSRHIVGRIAERAALQAAFRSGRSTLLCVAGEPGIGKTTLVEDWLTDLAAQQSCTIARGRCSERLAGTEAYLPLLEALESLLNQSHKNVQRTAFRRNAQDAMLPPEGDTRNTLAVLMKQLAPTWYAQVTSLSHDDTETQKLLADVKGASQERMKRELAAFLTAVAQAQPLVIFFDDLHWADVSTIDLLSFLAGKFDALQVLIVVTYRPSDMLLSKHPFLQIRPDLQARGLCRELLLEFLNAAEIAEYLALEFPGHRFSPEFPQLIHAKTEGSPLFMADLVRYLRDRGVIAAEDSERDARAPRWLLAQTLPDIERELPESVRGMIERKIAQLSEEDRKLLTTASVQGYEFDSAVVAQVLNLDADEIEERLEKLERVFAFVKLASEAEFPNRTLTLKYRFVHVLYQNALYASLRATQKATLNRDVALALEAFYGARSASEANELALLWEAARDYARASDAFLQAARHAAQGNAHREAVQLAERGLAALRKLPETPERDGQELGLQLTMGFSLMSALSWGAPEAGAAFNRARQLCQQMGDDARLFAALGGVAIYHFMRAEYKTAQGLCEQMRQLAEQSQSPVLLVYASVRWADLHFWQGDFMSAHQHGKHALALARREYHEAYLSVFNEDLGISARRTHSNCLWMLGYADQALALAQEAVSLAEQMSHPFSLGGAHYAAGAVLALLRDWPSSRKEFEKVFALAEEYALGNWLNNATAYNAMTLAYQAPTEAALERAKQAIASLRSTGVMLAMTWFLTMLGEVVGLAGHSAEGLQTIAEALALVERTGERLYEAELWRIKGDLLLQVAASNSHASGAQAEAEGCYHQALEIARQQSAKAWELRTVTSLARLWQQQGKQAEARQMLAEIYGWFTEGFDTADLQDAKALLAELQQTTDTARDGTRSGSSDGVIGVTGQTPISTGENVALQTASNAASLLSQIKEHKRGVALVWLVLLLAISLGVWVLFPRSRHVTTIDSIAILPFINGSNDPNLEYLSDGLTESLINGLAQLSKLRVMSRSAVFRYRGRDIDAQAIGKALGVRAVLMGRAVPHGDALMVSAELVDVRDNSHLWGEQYNRKLSDLMAIQGEISREVARKLQPRLSGEEQKRLGKPGTENTQAYRLYLEGRFHLNKRTAEEMKQAIDYFRQALSLAPGYALAWAGLADSYNNLGLWGYLPAVEAYPEAATAALKALELDDSLAETHTSLAHIKVMYYRDLAGAEREYQHAIELNPNYAEAHQLYAVYMATMGRWPEAFAEIERAQALDPLSALTANARGIFLYWSGQSDQAIEQLQKVMAKDPGMWQPHHWISQVYARKKMYEEALAHAHKARELQGVESAWLAGYIYAVSGQQSAAQKVIDELKELSRQRYISPYDFAQIYAGLGDQDQAFAWLEKGYAERAPLLDNLNVNPIFDGLRADPRYANLARRVGFRP